MSAAKAKVDTIERVAEMFFHRLEDLTLGAF